MEVLGASPWGLGLSSSGQSPPGHAFGSCSVDVWVHSGNHDYMEGSWESFPQWPHMTHSVTDITHYKDKSGCWLLWLFAVL